MSADRSITVTFVRTYDLVVATAGAGSGTVTSGDAAIDCGTTCTGEYTDGESVTLTAKPHPGSQFEGWTGACTGTATCSVVMGAARAVGAVFAQASIDAVDNAYPNAVVGTTYGNVDDGTARKAQSANYRIFGKTGTCTDSRTPTHLGWFGSFIERGNEKLVVVVLLTGAKGVSGPTASGVAGNVYKNLDAVDYLMNATAETKPPVLVASPIQGGAVDPYVQRRLARRADPTTPIPYDHPLLEEALRETLGVIVFQDQVLVGALGVVVYRQREIHRAGDRLGIAPRRLRCRSDLGDLRRKFLGRRQVGEPAVVEPASALAAGRQAAAEPDRRTARPVRRRPHRVALHRPELVPGHGLAAPQRLAEAHRLVHAADPLLERHAHGLELAANRRHVGGDANAQDQPALGDAIDGGHLVRQQDGIAQRRQQNRRAGRNKNQYIPAMSGGVVHQNWK